MHCPSSLPPPRRSPSPFLLSLSVPPLPSSSSFPPTLAFLLSSSLRFYAGIFLFPPPRLFANSVHPFLLPSSFLYRLLLFLHSPPVSPAHILLFLPSSLSSFLSPLPWLSFFSFPLYSPIIFPLSLSLPVSPFPYSSYSPFHPPPPPPPSVYDPLRQLSLFVILGALRFNSSLSLPRPISPYFAAGHCLHPAASGSGALSVPYAFCIRALRFSQFFRSFFTFTLSYLFSIFPSPGHHHIPICSTTPWPFHSTIPALAFLPCRPCPFPTPLTMALTLTP